MKAYITSKTSSSSSYGRDSSSTDLALVLPEKKIKVTYSYRQLVLEKIGAGFSLAEGVKEFDGYELGFDKLEELSPEEWVKYMENGGGLMHHKYECLPVDIVGDLVKKLKQKVEADREKKNLEEELRALLIK